MKTISLNAAIFKEALVQEKQLDKTERSITSYVSAKSIDRDNDIVIPEGIDLVNYKKNPVVLFNHDWRIPAIGTSLWQKADSKGLLAKTKFGSTPFADDIFTLHIEDILKAWSISFYPKKWVFDEDKKLTTFTESELLEYSSVNIPANPDALNEAKRMVKSVEALTLIEKTNLDVSIQLQIKEIENVVKELQSAFAELKEAKEVDFINDIEKLESKVSKIEKTLESTLVENIKKNFDKSGEILAGIDVKALVSGNITRAKENIN